jgi:hypothetical protein
MAIRVLILSFWTSVYVCPTCPKLKRYNDAVLPDHCDKVLTSKRTNNFTRDCDGAFDNLHFVVIVHAFRLEAAYIALCKQIHPDADVTGCYHTGCTAIAFHH